MMSARASVVTLLANDSQLTTLGVETVYPSAAIDTPSEDCFLVVRWEPKTRSFGRKGPEGLTVWAHDKDRSYLRIDKVLQRVSDLLDNVVQLAGADGWTLVTADWQSDSPDLVDDGFNTVTRYSEYRVVSRYSSP